MNCILSRNSLFIPLAVFPDIVAVLAGFLLPFSWLAGLASNWVPNLEFEWRDYLLLWEYDERREHFWSSFAVGFLLSFILDALLLARVLR